MLDPVANKRSAKGERGNRICRWNEKAAKASKKRRHHVPYEVEPERQLHMSVAPEEKGRKARKVMCGERKSRGGGKKQINPIMVRNGTEERR